MTMKTKLTFQTITRSLDGLTDRELARLSDLAQALIEARAEEREAAEAEADRIEAQKGGSTKGAKAGRGHLEYKTINGCGPYKYLRFWEGKTLKSQYLGKA